MRRDPPDPNPCLAQPLPCKGEAEGLERGLRSPIAEEEATGRYRVPAVLFEVTDLEPDSDVDVLLPQEVKALREVPGLGLERHSPRGRIAVPPDLRAPNGLVSDARLDDAPQPA